MFFGESDLDGPIRRINLGLSPSPRFSANRTAKVRLAELKICFRRIGFRRIGPAGFVYISIL